MRWTMVLLALGAVACRSRLVPERESEVYGGIGVTGLPHVGGTVTAGQYFSKRRPSSDFAFELRATYQGGDDSPTQNGKFAHLQAGVKQVTAPGHPRRWAFRYGVTWFRATGDPALLDKPGDYLGVFGAVAYEWQLAKRLWASPEVTLNLVDGEGSTGTEFLPQVGFHVYFDF
jgi:hypothetical protein